MNTRLENELIQIEVNDMGAELSQLVKKSSGKDYMWTGDKAFWTGKSPVLFPIIGSLNGGRIKSDGKEYAMANHGFARRSLFKLIEESKNTLTYELTENNVTLAQYPYHFSLQLKYSLINSGVEITYTIKNNSDKVMPFQIGTHPAFMCPMGDTNQIEDWYLELEKKETLKTIGLRDNLLLEDHLTTIIEEDNILPLKEEDFYEAAFVFKDVDSSYVTLKSDKTDEKVKVTFEGLPDLAIWQPKKAPFLCIEPWYGHGDPYGFDGDLLEKPRMIHLSQGESYTAKLTIEI